MQAVFGAPECASMLHSQTILPFCLACVCPAHRVHLAQPQRRGAGRLPGVAHFRAGAGLLHLPPPTPLPECGSVGLDCHPRYLCGWRRGALSVEGRRGGGGQAQYASDPHCPKRSQRSWFGVRQLGIWLWTRDRAGVGWEGVWSVYATSALQNAQQMRAMAQIFSIRTTTKLSTSSEPTGGIELPTPGIWRSDKLFPCR